VGAGKLRFPKDGEKRGDHDNYNEDNSEDEESDDGRERGYSFRGRRRVTSPCAIVSELLYNGKTLREVAGYDPYLMSQVLGRPRDKFGKLIGSSGDSDLPEGVAVDARGMRIIRNPIGTFRDAYKYAKRIQGISEREAVSHWDRYTGAHPKVLLSEREILPEGELTFIETEVIVTRDG
jgi:hypothetical protein